MPDVEVNSGEEVSFNSNDPQAPESVELSCGKQIPPAELLFRVKRSTLSLYDRNISHRPAGRPIAVLGAPYSMEKDCYSLSIDHDAPELLVCGGSKAPWQISEWSVAAKESHFSGDVSIESLGNAVGDVIAGGKFGYSHPRTLKRVLGCGELRTVSLTSANANFIVFRQPALSGGVRYFAGVFGPGAKNRAAGGMAVSLPEGAVITGWEVHFFRQSMTASFSAALLQSPGFGNTGPHVKIDQLSVGAKDGITSGMVKANFNLNTISSATAGYLSILLELEDDWMGGIGVFGFRIRFVVGGL